MRLPERREIDQLMTTVESPWVSIFMPTHRPGAEGPQDRIRLKNLLRQAEERLPAFGLRATDGRRLLAGAHKLVADDLFWRQQVEGLAVYCGRSSFRCYRLPLRFDEMLVVGQRPYVRPLLPLIAAECRFLVLALSRQQVRLFSGTRHALEEVPLAGVPRSFDEVMKYEEFDKPRRVRWAQPTGRGGAGRAEGGGVYRGVGLESEASKDHVLRFCQMIDRGLHGILREERAPMVVAGVEYVRSIYREANTYAHLLEAGVEGSPDLLKMEDLHRQAWQVVEGYFVAKERDAFARLTGLGGTGRASLDIHEIVPAATQGRVDTLWAASGVQAWGRFDAASNTIVVHQAAELGDQELIDLAAVQTILHAGTVYPLNGTTAPGRGPLAAIFRY